MHYEFLFNERLGIPLPHLYKEWDEYKVETQSAILLTWEKIRGRIPDRIEEIEITINRKQEQLNNEANFQRSCELNAEISELASIINDLWIWYRANQNISSAKVHQ
ncbi:hypothetical protein [Alkalihalobacillus sp. LMS39]|uniref:hypothetical protein n=1 Tax=Alkalihalobacillus sp. LMS39 TaxID=2924032 RepID=UPI001FB3BA16|nr:hypothetical protein [Alkalihalobacillus sp. LMS39]UOE93445.1 hypothetical protein MM271_19980 [Alkalihalobacillus sp. LMS39]